MATVCVLLITGCGVSNSAEDPSGVDSQMAANVEQTEKEEKAASENIDEEDFENETVKGTLTEIGYSAISADVTLKSIDGKFGKKIEDIDPFTVSLEIKRSDGTVIDVQPSNCGISYNDGQYDMRCHYRFDDIIDVDSVKSIIVGDTAVRVK